MSNEIINVEQPTMLEAINRAEVDIQIATAKKYPINLELALANIKKTACMDIDTAEECFYKLPRKNNNGEDEEIEGVSVRLAEIMAGYWGNLRIQSRIIGNDGRTITAQGVCHDLETNLAVSVEVKRSIVTKKGYTFSPDMQVVTGNAASAIAFRNAVLKVIPKAVTKSVINQIKAFAIKGAGMSLEERVRNMIAAFGKKGVNTQQLLTYCNARDIQGITAENVFDLRDILTAIKEGTTSIQEVFGNDSTAIAQEARRQSEAARAKAAEAMNGQQTAQPSSQTGEEKGAEGVPANVDPETGEIKPTEGSKKTGKVSTPKNEGKAAEKK